MRFNRKTAALLLGLSLGLSSTALAAGADSFSDVPKDHWSYEALDYLAKDGIIEGMGDGTFQGGRSMTRYEMATIVAKAMLKGGGNIGSQAVLEKLSNEYASEIEILKNRVDQHDEEIDKLKKQQEHFQIWGLARVQGGNDDGLYSNYNNRFYADLEGQLKVSDRFKARFTIEKNAHYRQSEALKGYTISNGEIVGTKFSHAAHDNSANDENHNGSISNIWVEATLGKDWYVNVGRKWNGIGMQNLLWGNPMDAISFYHPIEHGHGWWLSGDYWAPTYDGDEGSVPTYAAINLWGPIGKYIDANVVYSRVVDHKYDHNTGRGYWMDATNAYGADLKFKLSKSLALTASYVKTDASNYGTYFNGDDWDYDLAGKLEYKGTDLNKPGSYGLYAKWVKLGAAGDWGHDDEWTTRGPTYSNGIKGWYVGFKVVPYKNVEWESMYAKITEGNSVNSPADHSKRKIFRSQLDFHF